MDPDGNRLQLLFVHGDYHRHYTHSIHVQTVLTQRRGHLSLSKLWSVLVKNALTVHEHLTVNLCSPVNVHVQCIVNTPPKEVTLPLTQSMLS